MHRRALLPFAVVTTAAVALAPGCATLLGADFDHPARLPDAGLVDVDALGAANQDTDAGADRDAETVVPTPDPVPSDGQCKSGRKLCDGQCFSTLDPSEGCADPACAPCSLPYATPACTSDGSCDVGTCQAGRADCNLDPKDGCEVELATALDHCGACNHVCDSGLVCNSGTCTSSCPAGKTDCGGSCVDLSSSADHCGSCGNACSSPPNGVSTCSASQCGLACNAKYHSCGSTTCVAESASSCGASCTVCSAPPHATATCTSGACGFKCRSGYQQSGSSCVATSPPDTWSTVATLPTARVELAVAAALDGRVFAIGGRNAAAVDLDTVEAYDPTTNAWATMPSLPTGRRMLGAARGDGGRIYAVGGRLYDNSQTGTVEVFDPNTGAWSSGPRISPRSELAVVTDSAGRVYAIGGRLGVQTLDLVEVLDPASQAWSAAASLPVACAPGAAAAGSDGRVYVIGCDFPESLWAYDPVTNTWTTGLPDVPGGMRETSAMGSSADGRVFYLGGKDNGAYTQVVPAYDPQANSWAPVSGLPHPRASFAAARGADGRIYLVGGSDGGGFVSTVDVYAP